MASSSAWSALVASNTNPVRLCKYRYRAQGFLSLLGVIIDDILSRHHVALLTSSQAHTAIELLPELPQRDEKPGLLPCEGKLADWARKLVPFFFQLCLPAALLALGG